MNERKMLWERIILPLLFLNKFINFNFSAHVDIVHISLEEDMHRRTELLVY